jgi:hypothetical protein
LPILHRLLAHALNFPGRRGEDDFDRVHRWLTTTQPGSELVGYLEGEAGLLAMAANRLNVSGDEELREIGRELGKSAERLWTLAGTPEPNRR